MRKSISMLPSSMREWLELAVTMLVMVAGYAVIVHGLEDVVFFWGVWSAWALLVALYLFRRGALLRRRQAAVFTVLDKSLLAGVYVFGLSTLVALFLATYLRR